MNILMIASEVVPFSKTGGLADVVGSLPKALADAGHAVVVVAPLYRCARDAGIDLIPTGVKVSVPIRERTTVGAVWQATLPDSEVTVYLIENDTYFDRAGIYGEGGTSYGDNCERYAFFSRAALEATLALGLKVDVVHTHDWQTALVPVYLKTIYRSNPGLAEAASLLTIHNLAYQGTFWQFDWPILGLDWAHFNWKELEFHGNINLLKGGLVHADFLSTVSRTYAREIQTPAFGYGLEGVLADRAADLVGIVNGVDYSQWNPKTDRLLPARYSPKDLSGKATCKRELQALFGLPEEAGVPLIGSVGRLAAQKGMDILIEALPRIVQRGAQVVILGTGDGGLEHVLREVAGAFPDRIGVAVGFDEALAHLVEAGADMFVMPSRYEPCGLNQIYSLRYGTVPVVRATGGLKDTVRGATPTGIAKGTATGYTFQEDSADALANIFAKALRLYKDRKAWERLMQNGMAEDWSWTRSAETYIDVYHRALRRTGRRPDAAPRRRSGRTRASR